MSKTNMQKELKKPDAALGAMRQIFDALIENKRATLLGITVVAGLSLGLWGYNEAQMKKQNEQLGSLFKIQKKYDAAIKGAEEEKSEAAKDTKKKDKDIEAVYEKRVKDNKATLMRELTEFSDQHKGTLAGSLAILQRVEMHLEEKEWNQSITLLEPIKREFKEGSVSFVNTWMSLGRSYENTNQWEKALEVYKSLMATAPEFPVSMFRMSQARCYLKLGKRAEALKIYEEIEKAEDDPFKKKARGFRRLLKRGEKSS